VCGHVAVAGGGAPRRTPRPTTPLCGGCHSASHVETRLASCREPPGQQTTVTQNPPRRGTRTRCIARREHSTYEGGQSTSFVPALGPALREPRLVSLVASSRPAGAPRRVVSACTCRGAPIVLGTLTQEHPRERMALTPRNLPGLAAFPHGGGVRP